VIGKFLHGRIQEFDAQQDKNDADHGDIPPRAGRKGVAERHGHGEQYHLLAQRRFGFGAVKDCAQRIDGSAEKPLQGRSDASEKKAETVNHSSHITSHSLKWRAHVAP